MTAPASTPTPSPALPKAVLHDHLDGGLRPATVVELAAEAGHRLPTTDRTSWPPGTSRPPTPVTWCAT